MRFKYWFCVHPYLIVNVYLVLFLLRSPSKLEADYLAGNVHPGDLKPSLSKAINKALQVRVRGGHTCIRPPGPYLRQIRNFKEIYRLNTGGETAKGWGNMD